MYRNCLYMGCSYYEKKSLMSLIVKLFWLSGQSNNDVEIS